MKKIKYGNKKFGTENCELKNLKQGDEICEAVLDTFSDDYLSYITHLVKNTKTPNKNQPQKQIEHPSSDEQPEQKWENQLLHQLQRSEKMQNQSKGRRYSEASAKISPYQKESEFKKVAKGKNQSLKVSPQTKINEINEKEQAIPKNKKRKIEYIHNESTLKNEQKTMQFSRNTVQNTSKFKDDRQYEYDKEANKKSRVTHKSRDKYYITSQNCEQTDHQPPSIQLPLKKEMKRREAKSPNFIDNISDYITTLQEYESVSFQYEIKKDFQDERDKLKKIYRSKKMRNDDDDSDIQQMFKENLKLNKKVKNYEEKISQLDEEISNQFMQWKNKQKLYKNKINYLLRGLIQAFMKIDSQQGEIATLKDLHRTYGQKVKQVENKFDDDDILDDIREEIFKNLAPKRHSSEIRTKHKKVLESTLPKYDQDRRFW